MHKRDTARAFAAAAFMLLAPAAMAQTTLAPRDVPAKTIPVPSDVSPQLQAVIAKPLSNGWNTPPTTPQGWKQLSDKLAAGVAAQVGPMAQRLHVKITAGHDRRREGLSPHARDHPGAQRQAPAHPCPWRLLRAERR